MQEIGEVLNYLRQRGHNVGQTAVGVYGLYHQLNVMACSEEKIRLFAHLESLKDHDAPCDGDCLAKLAALCIKLAEEPALSSHAADEARDSAARVAKLQNPPTEPPPIPSEIEQMHFLANVLKVRMAYLLTREFRHLC
jgi:hypothetical protein